MIQLLRMFPCKSHHSEDAVSFIVLDGYTEQSCFHTCMSFLDIMVLGSIRCETKMDTEIVTATTDR